MSFRENEFCENEVKLNNSFSVDCEEKHEIKIKKEIISYKNDEEYREIICKLFANNNFSTLHPKNWFFSTLRTEEILNFESTQFLKNLSLGENEDTLYFDEELIMKNMDILFIRTKENPLFQNLYDLAAAKMFSTDRTVGQCILFSYDYLADFYECLYIFISSPEEFTENCLVYKNMLKLL